MVFCFVDPFSGMFLEGCGITVGVWARELVTDDWPSTVGPKMFSH